MEDGKIMVIEKGSNKMLPEVTPIPNISLRDIPKVVPIETKIPPVEVVPLHVGKIEKLEQRLVI